jgi:DNA-directed RNA polymerase subunit RPC12/RpoP
MKAVKCFKCGSDIQKMYVGKCWDCDYNGVWNGEKYIYPDEVNDNELRTQVKKTGRCKVSDTNGNGCWLYKCAECGAVLDLMLR